MAAAASLPLPDGGSVGLDGGLSPMPDGGSVGLDGGLSPMPDGGSAPAVEQVVAGLDRAWELVAMASQAPLAGADGEVLARVVAAGGRLRSAVEAVLLAATAALEAGRTGSGRAALRERARLSARGAALKVAVSEQLSQMPNVAHGLACGELTAEHAEVLADAARRTSPGAVDAAVGLLETAARVPPDVLRRDAREFVAQHDPAAAESELSRQRKDRSATLFTDDVTGMGVLNARFDPVTFALAMQAIENYNDALWRQDGGRDGTPGQVRDNRQRLADSVFEMLTGRNALAVMEPSAAAAAAGAAAPTPADAGIPLASPAGVAGADPAGVAGADPAGVAGVGNRSDLESESGEAGDKCRCGGRVGDEGRSVDRWAPAHAPNQLVIVADIGVIDGTSPDGRCEILGVGPVPPSILSTLSPDTHITGALFSGSGQPLWLGRSRRLATAAQQLAIAIRDRGCVLCCAPMHRCRYHHIDEWNADNGTTDIPNLAALCKGCHDSLHKNAQRLHHDPTNGTWTTVPRPTDPSHPGIPAQPGSPHSADATYPARPAEPTSGRSPP